LAWIVEATQVAEFDHGGPRVDQLHASQGLQSFRDGRQ
jgi:hypothetical protein